MTPDEVALLILAGGRSERFGEANKLLADLNGTPLGLHIAHQLNGFKWGMRIAVTSGALAPLLAEQSYVVVPAVADGGMGDNIAQGVRSLGKIKAILIVLADMPFVSRPHIQKLLNAADGEQSIVASMCEYRVSPPVLFGQAYFDELAKLSGDTGARHIIDSQFSEVTLIEAMAAELLDVDTQDDLIAAAEKHSI